ncbi:MAG: DinB family protein [Gemmatimonadales bacterium]
MPVPVLERPTTADYAAYYQRYIELVPAGDLVAILTAQRDELLALMAPISETGAGHAYAPGKWTIREVIGHLTDTERVFAYRATAFSRGDAAPLPGFDQDAWMPHGEYQRRPLPDVVAEWRAVRDATIALLRAMPSQGLAGRGVASDNPVTALAALTMIPGHVEYHLRLFRERYRPGLG